MSTKPDRPARNNHDLAAKIARAKARHSGTEKQSPAGMAQGLGLAWSFAGAIIFGTIVGIVLDRVLNSWPLLTITGTVLGFVAGITLLIRRSGSI